VKSVKIHYLYKRSNTAETSIYGLHNTCAFKDNRFSLISPITPIARADAVMALGRIGIVPDAPASEGP
jgi:hypothetical protein